MKWQRSLIEVQGEHASVWKSRVLCDRWHGKKVFLLGFVTGNTWMVSTGKNLRPVMCKCLHTWIDIIVHKTCFQFFCVSSLSAFFKLCEFYRHSLYILLVLEWMKQRFLPLYFNSSSSTKVQQNNEVVIQIEAEWDSLFNLASEMALIPQPCSWQIAPPAKKYVPPLIRVFLVQTLTNLPRDHVIRQDLNFAHRTVRMSKGHLTPSSGDHFPWINWRRRS